MNYFKVRKAFVCLLFCSCISFVCNGENNLSPDHEAGSRKRSYEIITDRLPIADPYVMLHNGKYYAYGTGGKTGFMVFVSDDLKHWRQDERLALSPEDSYGKHGFWAPEVYFINNRFYMFYTAEEHICVATATSPTGPFVQEKKQPIWPEKSIDTSLFIDDDGTPYLYFVRFTGGNVIWVAEMTPDLKNIKEETLTQCIAVSEPWERIMAEVAEGPSLLKKNGTYYMIYSANHYQSQDYGVGYATAKSPKGPWEKYSGNPILQKDPVNGLVGTGHGAPFLCKDGHYKYIFHAHWSSDKVGPRTSYIKNLTISKKGIISIDGTTIKPVVVK